MRLALLGLTIRDSGPWLQLLGRRILSVACETGEGAERLRGQKVEGLAGDLQPPDPDNAGEGKPPRRSIPWVLRSSDVEDD